MYLIGMTYSENLHFGWKDIEAKLSFIVFPILFIIIEIRRIKVDFKKVFLFFIIGCLISLSLNIYEGLICYYNSSSPSIACFLGSSFTYNMHVNHISIYYATAILLLFAIEINKILKTTLLIAFGFSIILFMSLGAFIAILFAGIFILFLYRKHIKKLSLVVFIALAAAFLLAATSFFELRNDYFNMYKGIDSKKELYFRANRYSESILTRIVVWDVALGKIIQNPFGVGTGDVKDVLIDEYHTLGLTKMERQKLNPHNQFLQTGVSIGLLGVLALLSMLILTIRRGIRRNNFLLSGFAVLITVNMLFESFLEIQAGIIFSSLFIFLLDMDARRLTNRNI